MTEYRCKFLKSDHESHNLGFFWSVTLELSWHLSTINLRGRRMEHNVYGCLWHGLDDPISGCGFYASWLGWLPYVLIMKLSGIFLPQSSVTFQLSPDRWVRRAGSVLEFAVQNPQTREDQLLVLVFRSSDEAIQVSRMLKTAG